MAKKYLDGINFDAPSKGFQGTLTIRDTEARGLIQDNANDIASLTAKEQVDRRDIDTNTDDITALKNRCVDIENKNDEQDDRLTTAEHNIVSVTSRVTIAEQDIDNLETRMDTAEADIDALEGRMTTAETDIDALEGRMTTAESDIDALEGRMTTAESDIDALEGRMDTAEDDIEDIKAKDVEQDTHLADLDDRVAASTYEAGIGIYFGQGVKHTNINVDDELIDQINQNTIDNQRQDEEIDALENRMDAAETDIDNLQNDVDNLENRMDDVEHKNDEQDAEIEALKNKIGTVVFEYNYDYGRFTSSETSAEVGAKADLVRSAHNSGKDVAVLVCVHEEYGAIDYPHYFPATYDLFHRDGDDHIGLKFFYTPIKSDPPTVPVPSYRMVQDVITYTSLSATHNVTVNDPYTDYYGNAVVNYHVGLDSATVDTGSQFGNFNEIIASVSTESVGDKRLVLVKLRTTETLFSGCKWCVPGFLEKDQNATTGVLTFMYQYPDGHMMYVVDKFNTATSSHNIKQYTCDIFNYQAAISELINEGPKNLLKNVTGTTTSGGLTFTVDDDGSILVTGSAPSTNVDYTVNGSLFLKAGTYVLTGCPAGGNNNSTYKIQIAGLGYDLGSGYEFTLTQDQTVNVYIRVWAGHTPSNLIFKPMICRKVFYDITPLYVPYRPSYDELVEAASSGGGGSVDKYDITLTVYPTGIANTPTPRFDKCNGYTLESDITTQLHKLYTALVNGEHPIVTLNFLFSFNGNTLTTLCPVSVTPIDSTYLCLTWENSVPPATVTGGGLPATRYVHMCYVNHTGNRRYGYTQKTYSLS